jgi:hypothetical protein
VRISPLPKESLVEELKNVDGIMCVVDFDTSWEPADDFKPMWVPHDGKHGLFALNIGSGFCGHHIFDKRQHPRRPREEEKSELITHGQMIPTVFSRCF